jgi:hypothetical protein
MPAKNTLKPSPTILRFQVKMSIKNFRSTVFMNSFGENQYYYENITETIFLNRFNFFLPYLFAGRNKTSPYFQFEHGASARY